jgi:hypothetical protein
MIGPVTAAALAVLFAALLAGLVVAFVDRWRGQPWIMRPYFAREYPAYDHRHPVDDTARRHNDAPYEQRRREHWRLAPTVGR